MGLANNAVISKISKKNSGGTFDEYNIGPELRFVGAQYNSNNNNLEEQLIIGTDKVKVSEQEVKTNSGTGEDYLEVNETSTFKISSASDNYYVLDRTINKEIATSIDGNKLILDLSPKVSSVTETLSFVHNGTKETVSEKTVNYNYNNDVVTESSVITPRP